LKPTLRRVALATLALLGCANDDWIFRARDAAVVAADARGLDAAATGDRPTGTDATATDRGTSAGDVATSSDLGIRDAGMREDGTVPPDLGVTIPDSGAPLTGLRMRVQGIASTAGLGSGSGSLRLTETGFEMGSRTCVGGLCMAGGLVP
jgi:hypothetical protein